MYDIAIIGAGPAGSTLARLIGKNFKVLLIDKRPLTDDIKGSHGKTKCCGGLLAPDAQKMLALLGLGLPQEVIVGPQLFTVRTIDLNHRLERYYQRFYINVDRQKFDRWLVSLIPPDVDVRSGAMFKSFERQETGFNIKFVYNGKEYMEHARFLIGADGANSMIRRQAFPGHPLPKKYIAVQEWFYADKVFPYFTTIFDREITDFYSWTIPKENFILIGAALSPQEDIYQKYDLLKERLRQYGFQFSHRFKKEGAVILRPVSTRQICTGNNQIALLGEAAGWISPSSAEGLSYAFKSALICAQSLLQNAEDFLKSYSLNTQQMRKNIVLKNLKSPFMYNPFIRKMVMRSGLLSMDVFAEHPDG